MEFEQGDIVSCTVDRIVGTTVFVNIDGTDKEGSIILSEVAPGRIRNLREYVVPKKTIICKVLRVSGENLNLSLRRVKEKEKKEILEQNKLERSYLKIMKTILKERTKEIVEGIKKTQKLYDFLEEAKEDSKKLEKLIGKEDSKKILDILKAQKKKTIVLKKELFFSTSSPEGLKLIKELLGNEKEVEIKYIKAGKYSIKREDTDLKKADTKIKEIIEKIISKAKGKDIEINYK